MKKVTIDQLIKKPEAEPTERNYRVELDLKAAEVVIHVPIGNESYPLTKTGKKLLLASTHGFDEVEGTPISFSLNMTAPLPG